MDAELKDLMDQLEAKLLDSGTKALTQVQSHLSGLRSKIEKKTYSDNKQKLVATKEVAELKKLVNEIALDLYRITGGEDEEKTFTITIDLPLSIEFKPQSTSVTDAIAIGTFREVTANDLFELYDTQITVGTHKLREVERQMFQDMFDDNDIFLSGELMHLTGANLQSIFDKINRAKELRQHIRDNHDSRFDSCDLFLEGEREEEDYDEEDDE